MFKSITERPFWVNVLAAFGLLGVLVLAIFWLLGTITHHGDYEKVPLVTGKLVQDAVAELEAKGFAIEMQDSVWDENLPPLAVIRQSPEADQLVKVNRRIYLTINRTQPPLVDIPNMVGLSFRNAQLYLKQLGLKLGDTTRRPDIARDAVLEQLLNGRLLKPGEKVYQGSEISFVIGSGLGREEFEVPDLIGTTYEAAKERIAASGLIVAGLVVDADVSDTAAAFVYRQNPDHATVTAEGLVQKNKIRAGQSIDLWIGTQMPAPPVDTTSTEIKY